MSARVAIRRPAFVPVAKGKHVIWVAAKPGRSWQQHWQHRLSGRRPFVTIAAFLAKRGVPRLIERDGHSGG